MGRKIVIKQRIPKKYRHPHLDKTIRNARLIREVKVLVQAKQNGLNVPFVFFIDKEETSVVIQKIDGTLLKEIIETPHGIDFLSDLGRQVALLHNLNIVHGDLTTSNVVIENRTEKTFLIDFGLALFSSHIEEKAVDINVLLRTLQSTHPTVWAPAWDNFIGQYLEIARDGHRILKRMRKIDERVRYKSH